MLHETNFLRETDWNFYIMDTSSKGIGHSENTTVTVNPINSCKTELDMSSISKPVADDGASEFANLSNGGRGITNLDISSFRKSKANDQPNNDCEFSIDNKFTEAMVNERQASLKLVNVSDFEVHTKSLCQPIKEESNVLSPSTTWKIDSPRNTIASCGDIVSETGTCISCSPENAGSIVRDIPVYDGTTSKDKLPIVSGCSVVTEKMPNFKTSIENEMNCHEHVLETIALQLKMIEVKDEKNIPEGPGASVVKGLREERLTQLHQDDKLILEESFILHTSSFEEKHVSNPIDLEDNAEHRGAGSRSDDSINESSGLPSDKMENILKDPEKDGDEDRESSSFSTYQKETNLTIPVRISEKESVYDSKSHAECLDVRLASSSESTLCKEDSLKTVIAVQFSGDDERRMHPSDSEIRSDEYFTSHDIYPGENRKIASDESHSFEVSTLNDQNSKDRGEFPNGEALNRDKKGIDPYIGVDNSLPQGRPFLVSEKKHSQASADLSFASVEFTDGTIVNLSSANKDFDADDLVLKGCSQGLTSLLVPERMGNLQDSFSGNHELGLEDSRISQENSRGEKIVVAEQKLIADDQISPVLLHPTKESIKTCDLPEKTIIDPEVTNYDTAKKSDSDNFPCSELASINTDLKITPENQGPETDPGFSGHPVIEGKTEESMVAAENRSKCDDQDTHPLPHSRREGNGACGITESLLNDTKTINHSTSETNVVNNDSAPTVAESDTKKNAMERGVLTSGFSAHPVSSAYPCRSSHESISGHPVSGVYAGRNSHESLYDAYDDIIGNSDMAESSRYTFSGPISGPISYSGPIPFSGNISHRSDSSTTSTRSFAFPILASEWNSSPVKIPQADPRYYRKKRGWQFLCFCSGSTSPD